MNEPQAVALAIVHEPPLARAVGHDQVNAINGNQALADIIAERLEQVGKHGFSPLDDLAYELEELPRAGLAYLGKAIHQFNPTKWADLGDRAWPWADGFNPADARKNLVKAAALIWAAIDRLDNGNERDADEQEAA